MTLKLHAIPTSNDPAASGGQPSLALAGIPTTPSRRGFMRTVVFAGLTLGASALLLGVSRRGSAETSPTGLTEWSRNDCADAYPGGYTQVADQSNSAYTYDAAACFGAPISNKNCRLGWHFNPTTGRCQSGSPYNAWRWTVNGRTYRCSDGFASGTTTLTICRQRVTA
ncbi:hypothetical protein [Micromonospora deserti]|uniref:Uncharacterized protein n=1 Tax=Micromonospora deserti TaxID=2070366 RepID=A0A2W2DA65_9ACTN|nr:hypothetical protein [Micromonospora deserti]PZG02225.1 hypothetical protein C1I99_03745 [Micromonospora deserti]